MVRIRRQGQPPQDDEREGGLHRDRLHSERVREPIPRLPRQLHGVRVQRERVPHEDDRSPEPGHPFRLRRLGSNDEHDLARRERHELRIRQSRASDEGHGSLGQPGPEDGRDRRRVHVRRGRPAHAGDLRILRLRLRVRRERQPRAGVRRVLVTDAVRVRLRESAHADRVPARRDVHVHVHALGRARERHGLPVHVHDVPGLRLPRVLRLCGPHGRVRQRREPAGEVHARTRHRRAPRSLPGRVLLQLPRGRTRLDHADHGFRRDHGEHVPLRRLGAHDIGVGYLAEPVSVRRAGEGVRHGVVLLSGEDVRPRRGPVHGQGSRRHGRRDEPLRIRGRESGECPGPVRGRATRAGSLETGAEERDDLGRAQCRRPVWDGAIRPCTSGRLDPSA